MSDAPKSVRRWLEVIVIGGSLLVLSCLLLMQDFRGRGEMRKAQCMNNLRQIGMATHCFHTNKSGLPPYVVDFGIFDPAINPEDPWDPDAPARDLVKHRKIGPVHVALLPYIDQQPIYEVWSHHKYPILGEDNRNVAFGDGFRVVASPNISTMICPANFEHDWTNNSYSCNTGFYSSTSKSSHGVFRNTRFAGLLEDGSPTELESTFTLEEIADGLAQTILFAESLQAMPWHRAGFIEAKDLILEADEEQVRFEPTARFTQGMVWHAESDDASLGLPAVKAVHRINGTIDGQTLDRLRMTRETAADLARPSSLHTAGVNMVFADGSVRTISPSIDYRVYQSMLSPDDQASPPPLGPRKN